MSNVGMIDVYDIKQVSRMFQKLDHDDREDIIDYIKIKLKKEKYNPSVQHFTNNIIYFDFRR